MSAPVAHLIVRRLDTREEIHRVPLQSTGDQYVEKALRGLLRNMDTDRYFVDTSKADAAQAGEVKP